MPSMADKLSETIAFRVHPELKRLIHSEARSVGLRPGDYLRRRVEALFSFAPDAKNLGKRDKEICPQEIEWSEPDDDQD